MLLISLRLFNYCNESWAAYLQINASKEELSIGIKTTTFSTWFIDWHTYDLWQSHMTCYLFWEFNVIKVKKVRKVFFGLLLGAWGLPLCLWRLSAVCFFLFFDVGSCSVLVVRVSNTQTKQRPRNQPPRNGPKKKSKTRKKRRERTRKTSKNLRRRRKLPPRRAKLVPPLKGGACPPPWPQGWGRDELALRWSLKRKDP